MSTIARTWYDYYWAGRSIPDEECLSVIRRLLQITPMATEIMILTGQWETASRRLSAIDFLRPELIEEHLRIKSLLADLCHRRGNYQKSLNLYRDIEKGSAGDKFRHFHVEAVSNQAIILGSQGEWKSSRDLMNTLIDQESQHLTPLQKANLRLRFGALCLNVMQPELAVDHFAMALEIYTQLGDRSGISSVLINLGNVFYQNREIPEALDFYQRAMHIKLEIGDKRGIANAANNIGGLQMILGQLQNAVANLDLARRMKLETGDLKGAAGTLINLAVLLVHYRHDYDQAERYLLQALAIMNKLNLPLGIAMAHVKLGGLYNDRKQCEQARQHLQRGEQFIRDFELEKFRPELFFEQAYLEFLSNNPDQALMLVNESLRLNQGAEDTQSTFDSKILKAKIIAAHNPAAALNILDRLQQAPLNPGLLAELLFETYQLKIRYDCFRNPSERDDYKKRVAAASHEAYAREPKHRYRQFLRIIEAEND